MASNKTEIYRITSQEAPVLTQEINFILGRITDRLDNLSGIRGEVISFSAKNERAVTIASTRTSLQCDVNLGTVNVGDRILVNSQASFLKGGTLGDNTFFLNKSDGSANFRVFDAMDSNSVFSGSSGWRTYYPNFPAGKVWITHLSGFIEIIKEGTLTLDLGGISAGSDSTLSISGEAQMSVIILNR